MVAAVAGHRMQEALQRRAAGDRSWWRLREAALTALATQVSKHMSASSPALDTNAILSSILEHDLRSPDTPPFLRGGVRSAEIMLKNGRQDRVGV